MAWAIGIEEEDGIGDRHRGRGWHGRPAPKEWTAWATSTEEEDGMGDRTEEEDGMGDRTEEEDSMGLAIRNRD